MDRLCCVRLGVHPSGCLENVRKKSQCGCYRTAIFLS